jgi:hypothetical protein
LGAGKFRTFMGIVMHGPYRKKCHQEFPNQHHDTMVHQKGNLKVKHSTGVSGNA